MPNHSEFPELGLHPEFASAHIAELMPATEKTIADLWSAAKALSPIRAFACTIDDKYFVIQTAKEGEIPTGVVGSISVQSIGPNGRIGQGKVLYNLIKTDHLAIEKLYLGPVDNDPVSIEHPADLIRFMRLITHIEQSHEYARALGLLEVSQMEAEALLAALCRAVNA